MKRFLILLLAGLALLGGCARPRSFPEPEYLSFQEGEFACDYPAWTPEPDSGSLPAVSQGTLGVWLHTYPGYPQFALRLAKDYIVSNPQQQQLVAQSGPDDWPLWLEQETTLGETRVRTRTTYYYANGQTYALIVGGEAGAYEAARPLWERLWGSVQWGAASRLPRPQSGRVGLAINPAQADDTHYVDAVRRVAEIGVQVSQITLRWGDMELQDGRYDWSVLDDRIAAGRGHGLVISLQLPLPDGDTLGALPADLPARSLNDPALRERFRRFLAALAQRCAGQVRYLTLGRGVDRYLAAHPTESEAMTAFLAEARQALPEAQLGVGLGAPLPQEAGLSTILAEADFVALSLIPSDATERLSSDPEQAAVSDLEQALALAGEKPIAITEAAWPSAAAHGGSETGQAAYAGTLLEALSAKHERILFLAWAPLHDPPEVHCAGDPLAPCSHGLLDATGNPKPAWHAFVQGVRRRVLRNP